MMNNRKLSILFIGLSLSAAVGLLFLAFAPVAPEVQHGEPPPGPPAVTGPRGNKPDVRPERPQPPPKPPRPRPPSVLDGLSPAERKLMANIQEASDSEDRNALHEMLKDVLASTNSVVHQEFVDALGWYGQGSIVDLAFFLNDPDPDVRENAGNKWELAIGEIEDESTKAAIVEETLKSVNDPNLLETVAAQLNGIDEKLAIESICRVMSDINGKARAAVKEPYEFITGEEWTSRAAARAWLQENYTPPSAR